MNIKNTIVSITKLVVSIGHVPSLTGYYKPDRSFVFMYYFIFRVHGCLKLVL